MTRARSSERSVMTVISAQPVTDTNAIVSASIFQAGNDPAEYDIDTIVELAFTECQMLDYPEASVKVPVVGMELFESIVRAARRSPVGDTLSAADDSSDSTDATNSRGAIDGAGVEDHGDSDDSAGTGGTTKPSGVPAFADILGKRGSHRRSRRAADPVRDVVVRDVEGDTASVGSDDSGDSANSDGTGTVAGAPVDCVHTRRRHQAGTSVFDSIVLGAAS
ncbi:hypothetical protein LG293_16140 (plasmid) [Citricoccus nitrophenolicus]